MSDNMSNPEMQELVQVLHNIQDALTSNGVTLELQLPKICVIGGQSVGKSSVLENIIGKEFLPRGQGIVTRCPIIMKCKKSEEEYATFDKGTTGIFDDFQEVREEIERQTRDICGDGKNISHTPISLTIRSPHVLDLILIDLPGMTRAAVAGQPKDVEQQTIKLVKEYVRPKNVIILAVSAANVDLANSDAMKIAQEIDPHGERTIGVLTKVDRVENETNARDILSNKMISLRLGFVAVRNRTLKEIEEGMSIVELREKERLFFEEHPHYSDIAQKQGVPYLQKKLNNELIKHIQMDLPGIRKNLKAKVKQTKNDLRQMQEEESDPEQVIIGCLSEYGAYVRRELEGYTTDVSIEELSGGAQINMLFYSDFPKILHLEKDQVKCTDETVRMIIKNLRAKRNGMFMPDLVYDAIIANLIQYYKERVPVCVEKAKEELQKCTKMAAGKLQSYPLLREKVTHLVDKHMRKQEEETKDHLETQISIEASFINTKSPYLKRELDNKALPGFGSKPMRRQEMTLVVHKSEANYKTHRVLCDVLENRLIFESSKTTCVVHLDQDTKMLKQKAGEITLSRKNRPLIETSNKITLVFKNEKQMHHWDRHLRKFCDSYHDPEDSKELAKKEHQAELALLYEDDPSKDDVETIIGIVDSYMKVVEKTIVDLVPKCVMHLLVDSTQNFIQKELAWHLRRDNKDMAYLVKTDDNRQERIQECSRENKAAKKGLEAIKDFDMKYGGAYCQ